MATRNFKITYGSHCIFFGQYCSVDHCITPPGQEWRCPGLLAETTQPTAPPGHPFSPIGCQGNVGVSYSKTAQQREPLSKANFAFGLDTNTGASKAYESSKATSFALKNCMAISIVSEKGGGATMSFPNIPVCLPEPRTVNGIEFSKSLDIGGQIVKCSFCDRVKIAHFLSWKKIRTKIQIASPSHHHFSHSLPVLLAVLQNKINPFIIPHTGSKEVFPQAPEQTLWTFLPINARLHSKLFFLIMTFYKMVN